MFLEASTRLYVKSLAALSSIPSGMKLFENRGKRWKGENGKKKKPKQIIEQNRLEKKKRQTGRNPVGQGQQQKRTTEHGCASNSSDTHTQTEVAHLTATTCTRWEATDSWLQCYWTLQVLQFWQLVSTLGRIPKTDPDLIRPCAVRLETSISEGAKDLTSIIRKN